MTTYPRKTLKLITISFAMLAIQGCSLWQSSSPKTEPISLEVSTSSSVNPDINGRASPLSVYIYSVSDSEAFYSHDYFSLTEIAESKNDYRFKLIDSFIVEPKSKINKKYRISKEDRYIGIVAGFRDIEKSVWKTVVDKKTGMKRMPLKILNKNNRLAIQVTNKEIITDNY